MSAARDTRGVAPLTNLVERTLTVADLVAAPLWAVSGDSRNVDVAVSMDVNGFDVAGIEAESVTHYVARAGINGRQGLCRWVCS